MKFILFVVGVLLFQTAAQASPYYKLTRRQDRRHNDWIIAQCQRQAFNLEISPEMEKYCSQLSGVNFGKIANRYRRLSEKTPGCRRVTSRLDPEKTPSAYAKVFTGADGIQYVSELYCHLHVWEPGFIGK